MSEGFSQLPTVTLASNKGSNGQLEVLRGNVALLRKFETLVSMGLGEAQKIEKDYKKSPLATRTNGLYVKSDDDLHK